MAELTDADLDAIVLRVEAVWANRHDFDSHEYKAAVAASASDVPALVDEVRRRMATEQRARALHHRDVAVVITGDCAAEDCNHEELGDCDTIEFAYCAGCAALAEQVDCHFSERDFRPVAWPCPTIVALDGGE